MALKKNIDIVIFVKKTETFYDLYFHDKEKKRENIIYLNQYSLRAYMYVCVCVCSHACMHVCV